MGWHDFFVNRTDDKIYVTMGGHQTEKRARELATRRLDPWEVLKDSHGRDSGSWTFVIDRERSNLRERVVKFVVNDLDETERQHENPDVNTYLGELRESIALVLELEELGDAVLDRRAKHADA